VRHLWKLILVALAFATVGVAVPAAAPALTAGDLTGAVRLKVAADVAAASPVITCKASIGWPHNSSHVPGTVNSQVKIDCDAPVAELGSRVQLWYRVPGAPALLAGAPQLVADSGWKSDYWTAKHRNNAARPTCVPGEYMASGTVRVVAPPGYVPPRQEPSGSTTWRLVNCVTTTSEVDFPVM
jgi:hypothetical protein